MFQLPPIQPPPWLYQQPSWYFLPPKGCPTKGYCSNEIVTFNFNTLDLINYQINPNGINIMPSISNSECPLKGGKQTRRWSYEGDIEEKRFRSFLDDGICEVLSEIEGEPNSEVENEGNKENAPLQTRKKFGSVKRSRNKRTITHKDFEVELTVLMRGTNEDLFYELLTEYVVMPDQLFSNGYPQLTSNNQVRLLKVPFGTPEKNQRKHLDSGYSDSLDGCVDLSEGVERTCARCYRNFLVTESKYLTIESCCYHWGRIVQSHYTCCSRIPGSSGCTFSQRHVWNGTVVGVNEFLEGFKKTRRLKKKKRSKKIFALDCEMCYTVKGLELCRVTILAFDGKIAYDRFVRPENEVVDFNTRFSGVKGSDINGPHSKSFGEVQTDILSMVTEDTILIGHALDNDLRVLKLLHSNVIDTSLLFPHYRGYPYKNSLRNLMSSLLHKEIQSSSNGHTPYEDALSCLELIHFKLRSQYGNSYLNLIKTKQK